MKRDATHEVSRRKIGDFTIFVLSPSVPVPQSVIGAISPPMDVLQLIFVIPRAPRLLVAEPWQRYGGPDRLTPLFSGTALIE